MSTSDNTLDQTQTYDNLKHPYDHDEKEQEYSLQHDYLLKRKKRDVISSRSFSGKGTDLGGGYSSPRYGVFLFKLAGP